MARLQSLAVAEEGEEAIEAMTPAQQAQVNASAAKAMKNMDTNHDGKVSFNEAKRVFLKALFR